MNVETTQLAPELVAEFVKVAHGDFDSVKKMLEEEPALLHASCNWGADDWETGLGAAAHVGRRDIALYLLQKGARMDIFAAAMLGHVEIVKGIIEAQPEAKYAAGPHGIPLMRHAVMGGEEAVEVVAYLESILSRINGQ
jgi:hypothetical protein